jgi:hypothetical protein
MKKLIFILFCCAATTAFGLTESKTYGLPNATAVTISDTTTYSPPLRSLFLSATAAQTLKVDMAETGTAVTFTFGAAGTYVLPISVRKVYSTGTTVTGIVGLY